MALSDILNILEQYRSAQPSSPPANAQQDFEKVSQSASASHLAGGLTEAFRSDQTPPFAEMIKNLFSQSNGQQRAGILNELLSATGGGSGLALGSLSQLLKGSSQVTPQQAESVSPEAVQQLAQQAHNHDPSIVERASQFYSQHPKLVQALGAGALALVMSHMSRSGSASASP